MVSDKQKVSDVMVLGNTEEEMNVDFWSALYIPAVLCKFKGL